MLVSHTKEFIFTKTQKTAGTSVESYFERYCMFDGCWEEAHFRDETISEAGIIGYRGFNRGPAIWYNHMPAKNIRDLIGQKTWNQYFKFTVVRNPFDKMISGFAMMEYRSKNGRKQDDSKHKVEWTGDVNIELEKITEIRRFRQWILGGGAFIDRDVYQIEGRECLDYFIRFEQLHDGIKHVCDHLGIVFRSEQLPVFKKGLRNKRISIAEYYDQETIRIVAERYAWEIERFGYAQPY